jgi:hypothetical protein
VALAPVVIATFTQSGVGSATRVASITTASQAGDTLLVQVVANSSNFTSPTCTDSKGNVYTLDGSQTTVNPTGAVFRSPGKTGGPGGTPTVALTASDTITLGVGYAGTMAVGIVAAAVTGAGALDALQYIGTGASVSSLQWSVTTTGLSDTGVVASENQTAGGAPTYSGDPGDTWVTDFGQSLTQYQGIGHCLDLGQPGTVTATVTVPTGPTNIRGCLWAFLPAFTGTGALAAKKAKLAGTGTVSPPPITGTGAISAKKAALHGSGTYTFPAFTGTGAISAKKITLAGTGTVSAPGATTGTGAIVAKKIVLAGTGTASATPGPVTGTGALAAKKITLAGTGTVGPPPAAPVPLFVPAPVLIPVIWDGLSLNDGERGDGLATIVTDVTGWYGSPPLSGGDLARQLTDGAIFGFKTTAARVVTIAGAAVADTADARAVLNTFARDLAARAVNSQPADLIVGEDEGAGDGSFTMLSASVRADSDQLQVAWNGRLYFSYQVMLTAADPRIYEAAWQSLTVTPTPAGGQTGRLYPWTPLRAYASADLPNAARMVNDGTVGAPVWVTYNGDLSESRLTDGTDTIHLAPLTAGQQIVVNSETLNAAAPGGASRASYLMAGSTPLLIPPESSVQWSLYGTGGGSVTLTWRGVFA